MIFHSGKKEKVKQITEELMKVAVKVYRTSEASAAEENAIQIAQLVKQLETELKL